MQGFQRAAIELNHRSSNSMANTSQHNASMPPPAHPPAHPAPHVITSAHPAPHMLAPSQPISSTPVQHNDSSASSTPSQSLNQSSINPQPPPSPQRIVNPNSNLLPHPPQPQVSLHSTPKLGYEHTPQRLPATTPQRSPATTPSRKVASVGLTYVQGQQSHGFEFQEHGQEQSYTYGGQLYEGQRSEDQGQGYPHEGQGLLNHGVHVEGHVQISQGHPHKGQGYPQSSPKSPHNPNCDMSFEYNHCTSSPRSPRAYRHDGSFSPGVKHKESPKRPSKRLTAQDICENTLNQALEITGSVTTTETSSTSLPPSSLQLRMVSYNTEDDTQSEKSSRLTTQSPTNSELAADLANDPDSFQAMLREVTKRETSKVTSVVNSTASSRAKSVEKRDKSVGKKKKSGNAPVTYGKKPTTKAQSGSSLGSKKPAWKSGVYRNSSANNNNVDHAIKSKKKASPMFSSKSPNVSTAIMPMHQMRFPLSAMNCRLSLM